jgi:hypothetical protein
MVMEECNPKSFLLHFRMVIAEIVFHCSSPLQSVGTSVWLLYERVTPMRW